jgi:hypothetical protein
MRRIVFDYHEFFATRAAASYFDLTHEQKHTFKQQWTAFTRRISQHKIPNTASIIASITDSPDPFQQVERTQSAIIDMMVDVCTEFAPVLAVLTPQQIEHFKERLEERNHQHDPGKNGGLDSFRKKKLEEMLDNTKRWLGSVSETQRGLITNIEAQKQSTGHWEKDYLDYSRDSQEAFLSLVAAHRGDAENLQKKCSQFARTPEHFLSARSGDFKMALARFRRRYFESMYETLSTQQKQHLAVETRKLAADLMMWSQSIQQR